MKVYLQAPGMCNAMGHTLADITPRLLTGDTSQMALEAGWTPSAKARVGRVGGALLPVPHAFADYACRVSRLLLLALSPIRQAIETAILAYGRDRIGIVLGTSTSGIAEGEAAIDKRLDQGNWPDDYRYIQQELGTPAAFLADYLGILGPAFCVSTACTSSAKAFVSARELIRQAICDAVLVGGVDSLCKLTINGFSSLELVSENTCNPMSYHRSGLNIGEGAALFLMTGNAPEEESFQLLGAGESSDAYHISSPCPDGSGAEAAMRAALSDAELSAREIDYLNLHATATPKNDLMEARAVQRVFSGDLGVSGTKPLCGHLLGASGATELGFCWIALKDGRLPPHTWDGAPDPDLPSLRYVQVGERFSRNDKRACMSNSFAFGGNNTCLILGDIQ